MKDDDKENYLQASIKALQLDSKKRKGVASQRCLTSQVGSRLKLSSRPAPGESVPNQAHQQRIQKISESIFADGEQRTFNQ